MQSNFSIVCVMFITHFIVLQTIQYCLVNLVNFSELILYAFTKGGVKKRYYFVYS